jgi:hypothetical protein
MTASRRPDSANLSGFASLAEFTAWMRRAPCGTALDAAQVAELLDELVDVAEQPAAGPQDVEPMSWRERLWTVPAETRLGVAEVAEAMGRPKSWVYARTGPKTEDPLPHRKLDGTLTFTAGELRAWIRAHETVVAGGPMESTPVERRLSVVPPTSTHTPRG